MIDHLVRYRLEEEITRDKGFSSGEDKELNFQSGSCIRNTIEQKRIKKEGYKEPGDSEIHYSH